MIEQVAEATIHNFAFGLLIGCAISLLAVIHAERRSARQARRDVERRARERGRL